MRDNENTTAADEAAVIADDEIVEGWRNGHPAGDMDPLAHRVIIEARNIVRDTPDAYDFFERGNEAQKVVQAAKQRNRIGSRLGVLYIVMLCGYLVSLGLAFHSTNLAIVSLSVSCITSLIASRIVWQVVACRW